MARPLRLLQNDDYKALIQKCDDLIKSGQIAVVAELISQLNFSKVPRLYLQGLAKICRRAGLVSQGLRLLHPVIRNEKSVENSASSGELCEYSVLLSRNGSINEALRLLENVDAESTPEAFLYTAYCHISNWDYKLAIPLLEKFLQTSADDYSKLIARVNLASSYLANYDLEPALDLLQRTLPLARAQGSSRLVGNCLDLIGHAYFFKNDFVKSREYLSQALQQFGNGVSDDRLMIQKTESFISALQDRSVHPLNEFRQQATEAGRWEWVRETDLYIAKVQFQQGLVDHLLFGSPLLAFRERVQKELNAAASETYIFGNTNSKIFDLQTGKITDGDLNAGKKIHQALAALLKDFYAPRSLGSLFADLYPEEHFNVNSSGKRVGQLLLRTRRWLLENSIPASIVEDDGSYRFVIHGEIGIRLTSSDSQIENESLKWQQLVTTFSTESSFTPQEACERMSWPRSTFLRVVQWALTNGKTERKGGGRKVSYHFVPSQSGTGSKVA